MSDPRLLNDVQLWKARHRKIVGSDQFNIPTRADLLDHIDALEARIATVRVLHEKRDESYLGYPRCAVCMDGEEMALWPCDTISLLDGIE